MGGKDVLKIGIVVLCIVFNYYKNGPTPSDNLIRLALEYVLCILPMLHI